MSTVISDRPIGVPDDDLLGRYAFAKSIADMILNSPPNGSLRIGVFGGWGEGKTSVLELIKTHLQDAGQICVWIVPWMFSSREEVIQHLLRQIATELQISTKSLDSAKKDTQILEQLSQVAGSDLKLKLADILIGDRVKGFFTKRANSKEETLFSAIGEALGTRRLTVFIDDLDRVKPDIVPDLLLTLREALDYPNYFYVMALAPDVLERGLTMVHEGWGESRQFLEKIIEVPMYLPDLSGEQVESYARKIIVSLGATLVEDVIKDLIPLLPSNPRRLKLLLRFIASLNGLLSRFGADEVDWRVLYLCLMLRFEFPDQCRELAKDKVVLDDIATSYISKIRISERTPDLGEGDLPEHKLAPKAGPEKERFLAICKAIRERGVFRGRYRLGPLLALADDPPALTYKEIDDKLSFLNDQVPEGRLETLRQWLMPNGAIDVRKTGAFMDGIVELRNSHLEAMADTDLETALTSGLKIASLITDIMRYVGVDLGGFKDGTLTSGNWIAIFKHFSHWSHFSRIDYYEKVRKEERQLLKETVAVMPTSLMAEVLEARELDNLFRHGRHDAGFEKTWEELKETIETKISESLLKHFEEPNGLEQFWAIDYSSKGKRLLFHIKSHFHTNDSCRGRLMDIARRAKNEPYIQVNFLTYFRMLCYGASDRAASFSQSDCTDLLKDNQFVKAVWDAAVAQALNPRMAGSLSQHRQQLIKAGISEQLLVPPVWWKRLEEVGFFES